MIDEIRFPDVEEILAVVVAGGNVLAESQGARKRRHRVPRKQEKLVRVVPPCDDITLEELTETYPREWSRILKKRKGEYILVPKKEFFRNVADLAGRVNAALLAAYAHPDTAKQAAAATAPFFLGLGFDPADFRIWWIRADELMNLVESLRSTDGSQHVRFTDRSRSKEQTPPKIPTESAGGSVDAPATAPHRAPDPEDDTIIDAEFVEVEEDVVEGPAGPEGMNLVPHQSADERPPVEIVVKEDPVTGVWSFEVDGHKIQLEPERSYVRVDGELYSVPAMPRLKRVEDLEGRPLELVRLVVRHRGDVEHFLTDLGVPKR